MPVQNFGGAPQKNFRGQKHAKFGPISDDFKVRWRISPISPALGETSPVKFGPVTLEISMLNRTHPKCETFALDVPLGWGGNACTTFGGTTPLKIWEGKKCPKFSTFYDNFRVWLQISLKPMKTVTKSKRRWREGSFGRWIKKKFCEISSTTNKVIGAHVDLP